MNNPPDTPTDSFTLTHDAARATGRGNVLDRQSAMTPRQAPSSRVTRRSIATMCSIRPSDTTARPVVAPRRPHDRGRSPRCDAMQVPVISSRGSLQERIGSIIVAGEYVAVPHRVPWQVREMCESRERKHLAMPARPLPWHRGLSGNAAICAAALHPVPRR